MFFSVLFKRFLCFSDTERGRDTDRDRDLDRERHGQERRKGHRKGQGHEQFQCRTITKKMRNIIETVHRTSFIECLYNTLKITTAYLKR